MSCRPGHGDREGGRGGSASCASLSWQILYANPISGSVTPSVNEILIRKQK